MKINTAGLVILLAATLCAGTVELTQAEYRFGPCVYWAPYYYPTPAEMQCLGFKPEDFAPRYQSPNPLPPPDCPPPPAEPKRIASKRTIQGQLNGPVIEAPTPVPTRPPSVTRPAYAPRGLRPGAAGERPQPEQSAPGSQGAGRPPAPEPPK